MGCYCVSEAKRFQGEEQDETGLYYLRTRYMDPSTGTFTSMDTYGGSLSDPMSLHKYLFANSNPVKWCVPSGHMSLAELTSAMDINAIIDAACSAACFYIINSSTREEPLSEGGMLISMLIGGGISALLCLGLVNPVFFLIAGVIIVVFAVIGLI